MPYNRANVIKRYIDVQRITQEHYEEGITTYRGIWRKYIEPLFHYSYQQYINILGMGGLVAELEAEQARSRQKSAEPKPRTASQMHLFDLPGVKDD